MHRFLVPNIIIWFLDNSEINYDSRERMAFGCYGWKGFEGQEGVRMPFWLLTTDYRLLCLRTMHEITSRFGAQSHGVFGCLDYRT